LLKNQKAREKAKEKRHKIVTKAISDSGNSFCEPPEKK